MRLKGAVIKKQRHPPPLPWRRVRRSAASVTQPEDYVPGDGDETGHGACQATVNNVKKKMHCGKAVEQHAHHAKEGRWMRHKGPLTGGSIEVLWPASCSQFKLCMMDQEVGPFPSSLQMSQTKANVRREEARRPGLGSWSIGWHPQTSLPCWRQGW